MLDDGFAIVIDVGGTDSSALALGSILVPSACRATRALNTRHKIAKLCTLAAA
jgi:hypothetical protein